MMAMHPMMGSMGRGMAAGMMGGVGMGVGMGMGGPFMGGGMGMGGLAGDMAGMGGGLLPGMGGFGGPMSGAPFGGSPDGGAYGAMRGSTRGSHRFNPMAIAPPGGPGGGALQGGPSPSRFPGPPAAHMAGAGMPMGLGAMGAGGRFGAGGPASAPSSAASAAPPTPSAFGAEAASAPPYINEAGEMVLFVLHLPDAITDHDLFQLFALYGPVSRVQIPRDKLTGAVRGFAFINMAQYKDACNAIRYLNGHPVGNKRLKVAFKEHRDTAPGGAANAAPDQA